MGAMHCEKKKSCTIYGLILIGMIDITLQITTEFSSLARTLREFAVGKRDGEREALPVEGPGVVCLLVTSLSESGGEPFETLVQTISGCGTSRLDVPGALSQAVKAELVSDLGSIHGVGQILLVGEDEQDGISQLILVQHTLEFLSGLDDTIPIVAVDDEDDALGVLEVVSPQRTDLVLTTDIPHGELDVLVLNSLDVEANSGDGGDDFTKLQLVQNGGFTGGIETDHENSHLLLPPQLVENLRKGETHDCD